MSSDSQTGPELLLCVVTIFIFSDGGAQYPAIIDNIDTASLLLMFTSYQYWEQTTAIIQSLNTNIIENIFLSAKHLITKIIEEPSIILQSRP